jgi:hypothetical protein
MGQLLFLVKYEGSLFLHDTLNPFVMQLLFLTLEVTCGMGKQDSKIVKKVVKNELKILLIQSRT